MTPLPPPDVLAKLVSNVTQTMLGISFKPHGGGASADLTWRTAVLPIPGERPLTVGLSSDERGCRVLSGAMFSVENTEVDASMIDDALRELLNMTAGLLKTALALDQALGLPRVHEAKSGEHIVPPSGQKVVLHAESLGLLLWVSEGLLV